MGKRGEPAMSVIHVGHIRAAIDKRFRGLIDVSDVNASQAEDALLTRGLSAFVIAELCGAEDAQAASSVVDEWGDGGIDALYFDAVERVCYLVQSKWIKNGNGSVDVGSALKFKEGVHHFFQGDQEYFGPKMKRLWPLAEQILAESRNTFVLVLAYTGRQPLAPEVKRPLDELTAALNDVTELVTMRTLKQQELHDIVAQRAHGETIDLQIMLRQFGAVTEPYVAYYGQVDLKDIATWGKYGQYLYTKNIRGFKGNTDVNEGIMSTIRAHPQKFWYFNNGITVLAERITPQALGSGTQSSRVFECEGVSVVNGAQTVGSIVSAASDGAEALGNASVLVRIISLQNCPPEFGVELTRAANTQNRIENKDYVAQDPRQAILCTDLFLENGKRYVYRAGDSLPTPEEGFTFEEAAVALACVHPDISHCVQAKREVGKLWEDISKPPYTTLFNETTTAVRMYRAVEIMRAIEAELKTFRSNHIGKPKLIATHGNRFVFHMACRFGLDPDDPDLNGTRNKVPHTVATVLRRLIDATIKLYDTSYPSNLFKNLTKCKDLATELDHKASRVSP